MAHVIDFTLFYGGVASAPAAELPFAGSSFDVQRGTARRAVFGVPEVESVAIAELGAVTGAAPVLGVPALSYAALWEGAGGVSRTASIGAVSAATGVELGGLSAGARTAGLGLPGAYASCAVDLRAVPERAPAIGELAALQAVTVTFDGVAREAVFGKPVAYSVRHVDAESVADTPARLGAAEFYSAVTLDFASAADVPAEAGKPVVTTASFVGPDGLGRTPLLGAPSIVIEVFPASVVRVPAFGDVTTWRSALAEPASVANVSAQVGGAEFYSAVTLDFASVADVPAEAGKPVVTTASFVGLDGFGRTAVLGKPSITIEAFPASVVRQPAVGAAAFVSAKETAPASVPDTAALVSDAAFVSVALVRPAGMAAGSAEMGGAVTVETTALMLPAGLGRQEAFGRPSLAVIVRPDSLIHDSVIGGVDLIPAHTADMAAFVQAAAFGVPDVGFGLLVEPESVEPRGHTFGTPAYGWRKCPRWDFRAQVRREAELGAEIRPAPVAAQVWRGGGCVRRERTMAAVVARWADLHTVARRRNAMDAAVRRKEQI